MESDLQALAYAIKGIILIFGTMIGLAVGSFLNVVIHRVPRDESIVCPPSHCPSCDRRIAWYENIPIASWLVLRGRCRTCGAPISAQYPVVEAMGGLAVLIPLLVLGIEWEALAGIILGWHLIALALIDLETRLVPDVIVISMGVLGAVLVWLIGGWSGLLTGLVSAAILAAFFWIVRTIANATMGKEAMGTGDITLSAGIGIYLLPLYLPLFLLISSVSVLVVALLWAWVTKRGLRDVEIPFGPGLALGGWLTFLVGNILFQWLLTGASAVI